jgi:cell division protein FtsB
MDKYWLKIMTCHEEKTYVLAMALAGTLIGAMVFYFVLHRPLAAAADDYVRQAAKDRLGLVESGETIFRPKDQG